MVWAPSPLSGATGILGLFLLFVKLLCCFFKNLVRLAAFERV